MEKGKQRWTMEGVTMPTCAYSYLFICVSVCGIVFQCVCTCKFIFRMFRFKNLLIYPLKIWFLRWTPLSGSHASLS